MTLINFFYRLVRWGITADRIVPFSGKEVASCMMGKVGIFHALSPPPVNTSLAT